MASLDKIPLDVWHHILSYACTDGGLTGAYLARSSRAIKIASAQYRYHSIRLSSTNQLNKFLTVYEQAAASSADPVHVRHLIFTFLPGKVDSIILEGPFHMHDWHSWSSEKDDWNRRFVMSATRLFALLAPHLYTLAVLACRHVVLPFIRSPPMPLLRMLTILHDDGLLVFLHNIEEHAVSWLEPRDIPYFYGSGRPSTPADLAAAPLFPALEYLHLARGGTWHLTLPLWAAAAPRLAHLQLFGPDTLTGLPLGDMLARDPQGFFPALRHLDVQPNRAAPCEPEEDVAEWLREVKAARAGMEVLLVPGGIAVPDEVGLGEWVKWLVGEWTAHAEVCGDM